jgi:hypothetical protein
MPGQIKLMRTATGTSGTSSSSGLPTQAIATFSTAVLEAGNVEAGSILIAKGFTVRQVTVNAAARLRLYATQASQVADTGAIIGGVASANRPRTQPPQLGTQHGVILDLYLNTNDKFNWIMSPPAVGFNDDQPQSGTIYYAVDNISGVDQAIVVTITYVPEES